MEKLVTVREIFKNRDEYLDTKIKIGGWVRSIRDSKTFGFVVLNDGTFFEPIQVVYSDALPNFTEICKTNVGAALIVTGTLVATPGAKQPFEIQATDIYIEGASTPDYPLQKKRHTMEYLRTISHLRPRTNTFSAVFRVRSLIAYAIHRFFQERDFVYVHTPIITGSDCEGAGEMFRVTTLDPADPPRLPDGSVDFSKDFFGSVPCPFAHRICDPQVFPGEGFCICTYPAYHGIRLRRRRRDVQGNNPRSEESASSARRKC